MAEQGGKGTDSAERPTVVLAAKAAPVLPPEELTATVDELRGEVAALRRELRLLRIANAELERVAVRDPLTPLFNRRYFLTALNERLVRAKRYNSKAAILFIDVNRMKYINDVFGHSAGDYALVHIAQLVQTNIRATDVAARIGGDEFAIILEQVDKEQAEVKAEQLEEVIRQTRCDFGDAALPVSISIGLAQIQPNDTDDALIERADRDMYARKRAWHETSASETESKAATGKSSAAA